MNDYKDRFSDAIHCEKPISSKEITIRGYKLSDIKREDVIAFCAAKNIPPEWFISELIKEIH